MSLSRKFAAWLVHGYTMSGGLVAMFGMFAVHEGEMETAFILIILSRLIDATDGLMARAVRVWEALPKFSGEMVDNLIDIFTFLWLPMYIIGSQNLIPHEFWLLPPIIGTLYVYGAANKSEDNFFLGFPSLWGAVAIYMYYLQPVDWVAVLLLLVPSILSFIPFKYLYVTKNRFLRYPTWGLAVAWIIIWGMILFAEEPNIDLVWISLFFPAYYMLGSFYATLATRSKPPMEQASAA